MIAEFLGVVVSYLPAFTYGRLHYRNLDRFKTASLKDSKGCFESFVTLNQAAIDDVKWWYDNAHLSACSVTVPEPELTLFTDASFDGYGGVLDGVTFSGRWLPEELNQFNHNINALELQSVYFGLRAFLSTLKNKCVMVRVDNSTAVACINKMGSAKSELCDSITRSIWEFCAENCIWLKSCFIKGKDNVEADQASRNFSDDIEYKLKQEVFDYICQLYGKPDVDLFASRINKQVSTYIAWNPDPFAADIDAFMSDWSQWELLYAFPPFRLIPKVLQRFQIYKSSHRMILVYPEWKGQYWYPLLKSQLESSFALPLNCLVHPTKETPHPKSMSLHLHVGIL